MKLFVGSDFHFDAVTCGIDRHDELAARAHEIADAAIEAEADVFMFLGDLCDPDRGSDVTRALGVVIEIETKLAEAGIETIWMAGNHDVIEDGTGRTVLSPLKTVARVVEEPCVITIKKTKFLLLPFTAAAKAYSPKDFVEAAFKKHGECDIAAGHLCVPGMTPGEESNEMRRGRDVMLPVDQLLKASRIILNGHYHRQALVDGVYIPGSLAQLTFGEHHSHSYLYLEKDPERGWMVDGRKFKSPARVMMTIRQAGGERTWKAETGDLVRLIADGPEGERAEWEASTRAAFCQDAEKVIMVAGNVSEDLVQEKPGALAVEGIRNAVEAVIEEGRFADKDAVGALCDNFLSEVGL